MPFPLNFLSCAAAVVALVATNSLLASADICPPAGSLIGATDGNKPLSKPTKSCPDFKDEPEQSGVNGGNCGGIHTDFWGLRWMGKGCLICGPLFLFVNCLLIAPGDLPFLLIFSTFSQLVALPKSTSVFFSAVPRRTRNSLRPSSLPKRADVSFPCE